VPKNATTDNSLQEIALDKIQVGRYQPRKEFPPLALEELASSIRAQGVIQPIIVRKKSDGNYEIVAGERRFRAAKLAGLTAIPAVIKEIPEEAAFAVALIENIQREDLNPIEEATALHRLIEEFSLTHEQAARAVGKSRVAVSNLLRLLELPEVIKQKLLAGKIEMGHARALLSLNEIEQIQAMETIIVKHLSVRQTEDLVRELQQKLPLAKANKQAVTVAPHLYEMQTQLIEKLRAAVLIQQNSKGRGRIVIKYKNAKELANIFENLMMEVEV
jgi:ParB family chromosome partitioning protein